MAPERRRPDEEDPRGGAGRGGPRAGAARRRRLGPARRRGPGRRALRRRARRGRRRGDPCLAASPVGWVTAVPSQRSGALVPDFAQRLAAALGLPFVAVLERVDDGPPQREMANAPQQVANVRGAFAVVGARRPSPVPAGRRPALQRLDAGDGRRAAAPRGRGAGLPVRARDGVLRGGLADGGPVIGRRSDRERAELRPRPDKGAPSRGRPPDGGAGPGRRHSHSCGNRAISVRRRSSADPIAIEPIAAMGWAPAQRVDGERRVGGVQLVERQRTLRRRDAPGRRPRSSTRARVTPGRMRPSSGGVTSSSATTANTQDRAVSRTWPSRSTSSGVSGRHRGLQRVEQPPVAPLVRRRGRRARRPAPA